jgi:hypothetical protein
MKIKYFFKFKRGGGFKKKMFIFFDIKKSLFYFFWIYVALYFVLYICFNGIFVQNESTIYDYFASPGDPGSYLLSYRYLFVDIVVRMAIIGNGLSLIFILIMFLCRRHFGWFVLWFLLFVVCFLFSFLGFIGLSNDYVHCNGQNQAGNMCNSADWCCVEEIRINPLNLCPNGLPCSPPRSTSDLSPDQDFLGLYWTNFVAMIFQLVFLIVISIYWAKTPTEEELELYKNRKEEEKDKEEVKEESVEEEEEEGEEKTEPTEAKIWTKKKPHGLRNRK